jgi:signal transduction histidine kinase
MNAHNRLQIERRIARCRLILSSVALAAVFVDPTTPFLAMWWPLESGRFVIDPWLMLVMTSHLVYSIAMVFVARDGRIGRGRSAEFSLGIDVAWGFAIAMLTEGATSPFYPFFAFSVVVAGFRSGMRQAFIVTAVTMPLYLALIVVSAPGNTNLYIMRPVYLAIIGYLVGWLGQQRIVLQDEVQQLEAAEQRHRIARDLHDGFAQALAGINLRIEGCRRLLGRDDAATALTELTELQSSVHREYDELRRYMQTLAGVAPSPVAVAAPATATRFSLRMDVDGSGELVDHVLQIAREAVRNVRRHANAATARVQVRQDDCEVQMVIDDDGVGLGDAAPPWSIASRVRELGGRIELQAADRPGSHLQILLPQS